LSFPWCLLLRCGTMGFSIRLIVKELGLIKKGRPFGQPFK
jgi:hypothetical protein